MSHKEKKHMYIAIAILIILGIGLVMELVILEQKYDKYIAEHGKPDPVERPINQYHDIDVVITDNDIRHWFASGHHWTADVTIYSQEYDITDTFHLTHDDARRMEEYQVGDAIQATLFTQTIESTGEIVNIRIDNIQP